MLVTFFDYMKIIYYRFLAQGKAVTEHIYLEVQKGLQELQCS